jgi:uncharacterized membrane protein
MASRQDPVVFWVAPAWMSHVVALLMLPVMILLVASQVPAGRIKAAVKHPMLLGVKIWALAHFLVNGDLASLLSVRRFLAWAVVDRISEKKRLRCRPDPQSRGRSGEMGYHRRCRAALSSMCSS